LRATTGEALAEVEGPAAALAATDPLAADKRMQTYQPYWAARAHLLAETNHRGEAREALTLAIGLATDAAVRQYLHERLDALADG